MRRTLALVALLAVATFWAGCAKESSSTGNASYKTDSAASPPSTAPAVNAGNANSNTSSSGNAPTGIKPPMKNDK